MTTSIGQPGQVAYGIRATDNDGEKQFKALIQTLNAKSVQVAALVQSVTGLAQAAASDPLAADLAPTSELTEGTASQLPASAEPGDVFLLDGTPAQVYICQTAYSSGGTLAGNWALDTNPHTVATVMGLFATSRALTKTLGAYATTLSGSAPTGTPTSNQRWVQISPWPVSQSSAVVGAWDGSTGSWVVVTQTAGEWPDWVNFAFANAIAANIGNLFASYATITYLTSTYTSTANLQANYAKITDLAAGNLAIGGTATFGSTTVNTVIANANNALSGLAAKLAKAGDTLTGSLQTANGGIIIDGAGDTIQFILSGSQAGKISAYNDAIYGHVMLFHGLSEFDSEVIVEGVLQALSSLTVIGTTTLNLPTASSGYNFVRSSSGTLYTRTVANTQSDLGISAERFKTNIADLDFPLEDGYDLRPVSFTITYQDGSVREYAGGFIADHTPESLADLLVSFFDESDGEDLDGQVKGFDYLMGLGAVQQRLIRDLNTRLQAAEAKLGLIPEATT